MGSYILTVIFLGACSYQDIRRREISWQVLVIGAASALLYELCTRHLEAWSFLGGLAVGLALLALSFATRESLGYGDGLSVITAGMLLGFPRAAEMLMIAFLLAAFVSIILLAVKRAGRNDRLPFLPFLAAAAAVCMIVEGIA